MRQLGARKERLNAQQAAMGGWQDSLQFQAARSAQYFFGHVLADITALLKDAVDRGDSDARQSGYIFEPIVPG
jgi:hypothetical protein